MIFLNFSFVYHFEEVILWLLTLLFHIGKYILTQVNEISIYFFIHAWLILQVVNSCFYLNEPIDC